MAVTETNANELTLSFKSPPNYDAPGDADKDNTYKVSVVATDDDGLAGMANVEIVVTDVSEAGTVKLSTSQPAIGRPVTATLDEPDTDVSGLKWKWQSSTTGVESPTDSFVDIEDATGDTYTPRDAVPDDETTPDIDESRTATRACSSERSRHTSTPRRLSLRTRPTIRRPRMSRRRRASLPTPCVPCPT